MERVKKIATHAARYVRGQPETIEYYFLYLFFFLWRPYIYSCITKRCGNADKRKNILLNWKQWWFLLEKNLNDEEGVVIKTWLRLINKINSWMLTSFPIKPEINDTSNCCFARIHPLHLSSILENIKRSISVERVYTSSSSLLIHWIAVFV